MKTLIIDNYDSFTDILAHLVAAANGVEPVIIRNDALSWDAIRALDFDNIVISPGPGRPDVAADFGVSREAIAHAEIPLLGVCLGHQGLASFFGESIGRADAPMHGKASLVFHDGEGLFDGVPSPFSAGRYHSLIVRKPLPEGLREIAWTAAGEVMALARRDRPQWGVQFHPESILTDHGRRLIENFGALTRAWRGAAPAPHRVMEQPGPASLRAGADREKRIRWRRLPAPTDMAARFAALSARSDTSIWLDSADTAHPDGRWSYFADASFPGNALVHYDTLSGVLTAGAAGRGRSRSESIIAYLKRNDRLTLAGDPPPCPFRGGHVGWFGYEMRHECGAAIRRPAATPDALFIRTESFLAYDQRADALYAISLSDDGAVSWFDDIALALAAAPATPPAGAVRSRTAQYSFSKTREAYVADVERCLERIHDGESYQICLTNEIVCRASVSVDALYKNLRSGNPAPFAALIRWPGGAVLSASPERFLSVTRGRVAAKPIKGTIRRSADPAEDAALAASLAASEKDRAENIIIVDLLRNDLAKSCLPGSIAVAKLCDVESFATVHQLVSTIEGELRPGLSATDVLVGAFPGGSMTGAPKLRTMQIIDEFEGRPRGVYSGAIGWIGFDGDADLSIAIRTIVATNDALTIGVGGGIVAMSDPETEYDETMLKAEASVAAVTAALSPD